MMGVKGNFTPDQILADSNVFLWYHRNDDFASDVVGMAILDIN